MKTVIIACAGGMTSGLMCSKVIKAAEKTGFTGKFIPMFELHNEKTKDFNDVELLLVYGAVESLTKEKLKKILELEIDYVLIAPQMRYYVDIIKKNSEIPIGVESIGFKEFGMMRGDLVLDRIKELVNL